MVKPRDDSYHEPMSKRVPQSFIQDVISRTDIVELIQLRIGLKKRGHNYLGLCPFHQEKTPSFNVNPEKQFYYCFGCSAHGNAISFLMAYDRMEFMDALQYLSAQLGVTIPTDESDKTQHVNHDEDYQLLAKINQYYQQQLRQSPIAIQYLKNRGITGEIAKQFQIGYAPPGWETFSGLFPEKKQQSQLLSNGLIIQKNDHRYFDRFRQRIMFPIRDVRGRVIAFGGRTLGDDTPKYMNSPETPIFHKSNELYGLYEVRKQHRSIPYLLVVEGYMDVVSLHQHQITCAVATLGTAINARHLQKLLRYTNDIIFCFDGDSAGQKAGWRALTISLPLMRDGIHIRFLFLPADEDPDSLVRKIGHEKFTTLLKEAKPLSDVFFEQLSQQIPLRSIDDKADFAKQACELLDMMPPGLFRQFLLEQLAKYLAVDQAGLQQLLKPLAAAAPPPVRKSQRIPSPDYLAIALLLQRPGLASQIGDTAHLSLINAPGIPLLMKLIPLLQQSPTMSAGMLLEQWSDDEERRLIASLAARSIPEDADVVAELKGAFARLREQQNDALANSLIQKAKTTNLSASEKETLQTLLKKSPLTPI